MTRFLLCSFAWFCSTLRHRYVSGRPAAYCSGPGASEAQLHIAFSVYLAGMASAMLFAGRIADRSGRKPVAIVGAAIFVIASLLCAGRIPATTSSSDALSGDRRRQLLRGGFRYPARYAGRPSPRQGAVVAQRHHLHYPRPAPVLGHLIMLKYPWQSLFYTMTGMGVMIAVLSVFILRETRPTAPPQAASPQHDAGESLLNRFFLSRLLITTLSVTVILTYVNVSPVLMMEEMGFDRGTYSMAMALMAMISMAVSFSTPFALSLFNPRTLMLTSQVLFLAAGVTLSLATRRAVTLIGLGMICAGFSVGFGVAMSGRWGRSRCARASPARSSASRRCAVHRCGFGSPPSSDSAQ